MNNKGDHKGTPYILRVNQYVKERFFSFKFKVSSFKLRGFAQLET